MNPYKKTYLLLITLIYVVILKYKYIKSSKINTKNDPVILQRVGKSAIAKLLTGNQSILSKGGSKAVTQNITYYQCLDSKADQLGCSIGVIDIPGLDIIQKRQNIRSQISRIVKQKEIKIDGILYVLDPIKREFIKPQKVCKFIKQLPWQTNLLKSKIIPIVTHYNIILQKQQQQRKDLFDEIEKLFEDNGFQGVWQKRINFVAVQKMITLKKRIFVQLQNQSKNQIQLLHQRVKKFKEALSYSDIQNYRKKQLTYVLQNIQKVWKQNQSKHLQIKQSKYSIKIKIFRTTSEIPSPSNLKNDYLKGGAYAGGITAGVSGAAIATTKFQLIKAIGTAILTYVSLPTLAITLGIGSIVGIVCYALYDKEEPKKNIPQLQKKKMQLHKVLLIKKQKTNILMKQINQSQNFAWILFVQLKYNYLKTK